MVHTFVDSALKDLSTLVRYPTFPDSLKAQIQAFQVDLRFVQMFLRCLITLDPDNDIDRMLISSTLSSVEGIWDGSGDGLYTAGLQAMKKKFQVWNRLSSKWGDKIQQCKREIKNYCVQFMSPSFQSKLFRGDQILEFIDEILNNSYNLPAAEYQQFQKLRDKLLSLRHIVEFAARRCPDDVKVLTDFMTHAHTWANKAACLACLYWAGDVEDEGRMNLWIADLVGKVNPCTPEFIQMCFAAMKSTKSSLADDNFLYNEFVISFSDFLIETVALKDDNEILREEWIFLISCLAVPPADDYALAFHHEALLLGDASLRLFNTTQEGDLTVDRAIQLDFLSKIRNFRGKIKEHEVRIPDFILPTTDRLGFVERLLGKIEHLTTTMECNPKIALFAKHLIRVKEELTSLSRSIHVIWEELLQGEHKELKDLLDRMIDVAYQAELAVNSSFTIDHPIWYHLSCLSYVLVKIKDIQNEFGMFNTNKIHGIATGGTGVDVSKLPSVYMPPHLELDDEIVVGFKDEEHLLIDRLTRGTRNLDIVSIVGMGGIGKTTLARKLFNEPLVRHHFHKCAFCYVGPDHNTRRLLLEILREIIVIGDHIHDMTEEDLAHKLYKCLKGRRYLIIMDDIWDVDAWNGVKHAFPEDCNGSRIVFTTRIGNVALMINCKPHYLRFLSIEESWELLQAKVFRKRPCPSRLQEVGLSIAEKCKGLPLAVVVIAGVLARKPQSWSSWKRIADDLSSHASTQGCMYILELSYKHLPEALKSCLLYFGAFLYKKNISAKRLMLLWAAEGFAPKSSKSSNFLGMAKQYLNDLVHRNLVIVHQRSSTGGIKRCEVHDLVRELCRIKAREENFFHFIERSNGSNICSTREIYKQYRLCIHVDLETEENAEARRGYFTAHTLIYYYPNSPCSVDALPLSNVKLVQVLDVKAECDTFPEEVTRLVNLRYLTLKTHTLSSVPIPSKIANLWNLETFVLKCFSNKKICLPETIWKMKRLKHVDVGQEAVVELNNDVGKDSSKLPNIESFTSVTITYGESGVELLRRLSNVRKLSCYYYTCLDWQKKFQQLPRLDEYLTKLESLNIVSDGAFYPWLPGFPITLKKLSLEGVDLPWTNLSAIAKLPCLEVLKLMTKAFWGSRWDVEDEVFPNLKLLKLYGLDVEEWIASDDTFPRLEQIVVKSCYNLVEIPASFAEVPTLKVIEVYDCKRGVGESAIRIQEGQLEMGNMTFQVRVIIY